MNISKKTFKSLIICLFSLMLSINLSITAFASENETTSIQTPNSTSEEKPLSIEFADPIAVTGETTIVYSKKTNKNKDSKVSNKESSISIDSSGMQATAMSIPNGVSLTATPDPYGITVRIGNVGVDALDYVSVTVTATGLRKSTYNYGSVAALSSESHFFYIPMIYCEQSYKIEALVIDGGDMETLYSTNADLKYTESQLITYNWNRGTYISRLVSLQKHFEKHRYEIGSTNIPEYLTAANNFRYNAIVAKLPTIIGRPQAPSPDYPFPGIKYVDITTRGRYILLAQDNTIYSFGGLL